MMIWHDEAGAQDAPLVAVVHGTMDRASGMLKLSRRLASCWRVEVVNGGAGERLRSLSGLNRR